MIQTVLPKIENGNVCMRIYRESMLKWFDTNCFTGNWKWKCMYARLSRKHVKMVLIQTVLPMNVYIYTLEMFSLRVWDFQHWVVAHITHQIFQICQNSIGKLKLQYKPSVATRSRSSKSRGSPVSLSLRRLWRLHLEI